jgi:hypothetical protein
MIKTLLGSSELIIRVAHLNTNKPLNGDSVVCVGVNGCVGGH